MNESIIKEIKTIYSGRITPENTAAVTPEVKKVPPKNGKQNKTFFNGVIEKLDIIKRCKD